MAIKKAKAPQSKKAAPTKAATKPASKATTSTETPKKEVKKKRVRNSNPLYAKVSIEKLLELLGGDKKAEVTVSRNFVLDLQKAKLAEQASKDLGI